MKFANIILPVNIPYTLTYGVPLELQETIECGMRVEIPFGKNKRVSGIVHELHNQKPESYQIRPIIRLIDEKVILSPNILKFWEWISGYYCCTIGEVMQAALPAFLKLSYENVLAWIPANAPVSDDLDAGTYAVADYIYKRKEVKVSELQNLQLYNKIGDIIDSLLSLEWIEVKESTESSYKPKIDKFISLSESVQTDSGLEAALSSLKRAPKLEQAFLKLLQRKRQLPQTSTRELKDSFGIKTEQLKALEHKGIIQVECRIIDRIQLNAQNFNTKRILLSPRQSETKDQIRKLWNSKDTVLLKGVTGSGKTMIYIELIKECINKGQQALLMLPEIALTQHIISKLEPYFGEELGIYHSKYSNNERVEIWNKVKNKKYKIIVGVRSSIWLPFQDLGLLIVDEEHDPSFKQNDPAPRFNARDAAIQYAHISHAKVLLGSATPSFDTYHNTQIGKFGYVEINEKYNDVTPSQFEIVSNNNILGSLSTIIAYPVLNKIENAVQNNQQVIVFQNRRGYAPVIYCNDCQHVSKCHQCDVSLTYHKQTHKLHCHYCGQTYNIFTHCHRCGSGKLSIKGFGTEKIEEELSKIFSRYKISRLDLDTVKGKNAHYEVISEFEKGLSNILVGTQMVVKGLDFENVSLVIILNADALLYYPDFRVQERAFQLLVQVAGRAGRKNHAGYIMIQSSNTHHPLYTYVRENNYQGLYTEEMFIRKALIYPPFCRLIQLFIRHTDEQKCHEAAHQLKSIIDIKALQIIVNGPSPSIIKRVKNKFVYEILLKCPMNSKELEYIKAAVLSAIRELKLKKGFSSIQVITDVDPY